MNILLITTYFEPDSGAAAVRLSRLAHILAERGHAVTVLTTMPHYPVGQIRAPYRGRFAQIEQRGQVKVVRTWLYATSSPRISRRLISQNSFMLTSFLRGLRLKRPDVMLIEAQPVFTSFSGVLLSRFKRVPYVLNVSDLWPDHLLSVGVMKATHPAYRAARHAVDATYRGAKAITTLSPVWAERIEGYIGQGEKIQVIYNGVDLERFNPAQDGANFRAAHNLSPQHKLVTFIGTFATQYDFETLFKVVANLQSREDVQFVFIGSGSQAEKVANADYPNLHHIPWIDHETIPQAWAASDVTFWAMRDETLYKGTIPAKLYEALAVGVPIAAAFEGAGADLLAASNGGLSVNCGDVDGLTYSVKRLLDDTVFAERTRLAGRAYAEAHFDPQHVADRYETVLKEAIEHP